jgi:hypothetical protein
MNLDINVIHMSMDGYVLSEEDVAHLDFGPNEATVGGYPKIRIGSPNT